MLRINPSVPKDAHLALKIWLHWGRSLARYHRYEVTGLEHLEAPGAKLIVGYHGRGFASDLIILGGVLYNRLGYLPHSIVHTYFDHNPTLRWLKDGLGFVTGDAALLQGAVDAGHHLLVLPGGGREANRSFLTRYKIDWGERTGFIRLALRYNLPIVPVASTGVDDHYIGLNNGYTWSKRLRIPYNLPFWVGLGMVGVCGWGLPFPIKFRQHIGAPIYLNAEGPVDASDRGQLRYLSQHVQGRVQALLDEARAA